jgi:hypothetical protein
MLLDRLRLVIVTVLGLVGGAPGGETPRVADSYWRARARTKLVPLPRAWLDLRTRIGKS